MPGRILSEADWLECLFFDGFDPHFEGDEPPKPVGREDCSPQLRPLFAHYVFCAEQRRDRSQVVLPEDQIGFCVRLLPKNVSAVSDAPPQ